MLCGLLVDDVMLGVFVCVNVGGIWYVLGICCMGCVGDFVVVIGCDGVVYGIVGFYVVDVLLMLLILCVNMNIFMIMLVECIVDLLKVQKG